MERNKTILLLTVIAIIVIVFVPTTLKIIQNRQERLMTVATKKILESALLCYQDGVCQMNQMTLGQLKKTGYLESDIVNPKTKTYFDEGTLLVYENHKVSFAK